VEAHFEVVEATLFEPFRFDPEVRGVREGRFPFAIFVQLPRRRRRGPGSGRSR